MSKMSAFRTELYVVQERRPKRAAKIALAALVAIAVVIGLADIHLLPSFSADDFGSILFGNG